MSYRLYVTDEIGRSMVMLDDHNAQGNRCWYLPEGKPFSIVLEHETIRTYFEMDENGDLEISQEEVKPKPKPKRRRRRRSSEYRPGRR